MKVDLRIHTQIKEQVHAGLSALRIQGRQIWGDTRHTLPEIAVRLTVGVGDIARLARNPDWTLTAEDVRELKKELGNVLFSTIRWIDDLGLDVLECLELAIEAQEKFAQSGRPR